MERQAAEDRAARLVCPPPARPRALSLCGMLTTNTCVCLSVCLSVRVCLCLCLCLSRAALMQDASLPTPSLFRASWTTELAGASLYVCVMPSTNVGNGCLCVSVSLPLLSLARSLALSVSPALSFSPALFPSLPSLRLHCALCCQEAEQRLQELLPPGPPKAKTPLVCALYP
eukprot:1951080-Rhodomonas_salina.1